MTEKEKLMNDYPNALSDILNLTGIFRLEKGRWPLHAAELQGFALGLGRSLDFRGFHRFRFQTLSKEEVVLDYWIQTRHAEWARHSRARVLLDPEREAPGDTLPLSVSVKNLPPQRVEAKSYCLI
jgi:hypothetical protein